jgi:hypothetical protein
MQVLHTTADDVMTSHPEQQQQPDPRLLEALPGPALRRVMQLASTSSSPALCFLCCVSKGLRAAAEAAAPPMDMRLTSSTLKWLTPPSRSHLSTMEYAAVRREV